LSNYSFQGSCDYQKLCLIFYFKNSRNREETPIIRTHNHSHAIRTINNDQEKYSQSHSVLFNLIHRKFQHHIKIYKENGDESKEFLYKLEETPMSSQNQKITSCTS